MSPSSTDPAVQSHPSNAPHLGYSERGSSAQRAPSPRPAATNDSQHEIEDLTELLSEISVSVGRYCKNRPTVVAGVLFGLGFIVGWKAKPW